jgi:hypothetical protein
MYDLLQFFHWLVIGIDEFWRHDVLWMLIEYEILNSQEDLPLRQYLHGKIECCAKLCTNTSPVSSFPSYFLLDVPIQGTMSMVWKNLCIHWV